MKAIVLDGETRSALAVTRSLGRAGVDVTVLASTERSLAGSSRYAARSHRVPDPNDAPDAFCDALRAYCLERESAVWLPLTDASLTLVSGIRESLVGAVLPFPDEEALATAWNKEETLRVAAAAGLATPRYEVLKSRRDAEVAAESNEFPVVLKPRFSRWRAPDGSLRTGTVTRVDRAADLVSTWQSLHEMIPEPLLQPFIPGSGLGVFALADRGRVVATFAHRRLREFPPSGGVSVLRESVPVPEVLGRATTALLESMPWHGVAMLEFRVDARDGTPFVMEINPRFWGSLQLAIDAGLDFPHLVYRLACGEHLEGPISARAGVRSRWILGDLNHLWLRLKGDAGPARTSLLRAFLAFLNPFGGRPEVWRASDTRPAFHELRLYVRDLFR